MKDLVGEDIFVVIAMILLEHMLHVMRVIDQISWPDKEAHQGNVTVLLGKPQ